MGSPCSGGLLLRRAPLRVEDPKAETSGFKERTPGLASYNKGQCNERLAQAVWARVIALRWLLKLLYDLLENISLLEENIPSIVVFSIFLSLIFYDHIGRSRSECLCPILHSIQPLVLIVLSWAHNLFSELVIIIF